MEKIDKQSVLELLDKYNLNTNTGLYYLKQDINSLPTDNGYTTRNDEVVKMVEDEISKYKSAASQMLTTEMKFKQVYKIEALTDLLTKLKEDKK